MQRAKGAGGAAMLALTGISALLIGLTAGCNDEGGGGPTPEAGNGGSSVSGTVSIEGSSTVQPFTLEVIPAFEKAFPAVSINPPSGLGSGAGITAFINGEVEVAQASRSIKEDEIQQARDAGLEPFETTIFNDALAIIAHPDNLVSELSVDQVAQIFAGEISNWSEVGGEDRGITIYTRNEESGTFAYMEEDVIQGALGDDSGYSSDINKQASAPAALLALTNDKSGVFYAGLGNLAEVPEGAVRVIRVAKDAASEAVEPSAETVASGDYPIARGLFYYTDGDPALSEKPALKAFIEFVLSPPAQVIGEILGFLPVGPTQ